jgi:hypothetical protein
MPAKISNLRFEDPHWNLEFDEGNRHQAAYAKIDRIRPLPQPEVVARVRPRSN